MQVYLHDVRYPTFVMSSIPYLRDVRCPQHDTTTLTELTEKSNLIGLQNLLQQSTARSQSSEWLDANVADILKFITI